LTTIIKYAHHVTGHYSVSEAEVDDRLVDDHSTKQSHAIGQTDVFIPIRDVDPFRRNPESAEDYFNRLARLDPPQPSIQQYQRAIAVQDHAILPYWPTDKPVPSEVGQWAYKKAQTVARNKSPWHAERDSAKNDRVLMIARMVEVGFLFVLMGGFSLIAMMWLFTNGPLAQHAVAKAAGG
jgi:hypothetical protein